MPVLRTTALAEGMTLTMDAVDPSGNVILQEGTTLTAGHIHRLRGALVRKVAVRDIEPEVEESAKSDTVIVQEQLLRLAHMFNPYRDVPLMRELCRLAIKCAQERLIRG